MITLFALLAGCAPPAAPPPATEPATELAPESAPAEAPAVDQRSASLYALQVPLVDQAGRTVALDAARGYPVLLSMFYTSCPMACPLLLQEIASIEAEIPDELRANVRVVLVSMDPAHDDPAALRTVVDTHGLDGRWTLGAPPADDVRLVAAALGVRYRPLPEGGFAHTSVITLVDAEGHVAARSEGRDGRDVLSTELVRLAALRSGT